MTRALSLFAASVLAASSLVLGCSGDGGSSVGYWRAGQGGPAEPGTPSTQGGTPSTNGNTSNGNNPSAPGTATTPGTTPAPTGTSTPPPSGTTPQASAIAITLDKTDASIDLSAQTELTVSVAPNGYKGTVMLSASELPTDVSATFDKTSLTLDGSTTATAKLTLKSMTSTKPGDLPFNVVASADGTSKTAASKLTVNSTLTITIPPGVNNNGGTQSNPVKDAFGPYPIVISAPANISSSNPVTIHFYNADTVGHEIHASSPGAGFPHGSGKFGPGQTEPTQRAINMKGTYDFYLHDQNAPDTVGRIVIQ